MENLVLPEMVREAVTKSLLDLLPTMLQPRQANEAKTKEYFNVTEAAEYTRLAKQTLYQMTSNRTIPFIKKGGRLIFKQCELQEWMNQGSKTWLRK